MNLVARVLQVEIKTLQLIPCRHWLRMLWQVLATAENAPEPDRRVRLKASM